MSQPLEFSEKELAAIRAEYCKGATDTQFELFISECKARALRPGPHVVFQLRNAKEWDADTGASRFVKKPYWITTIGALRLIALRTGQYGGSTPAEYIYLDEKGDPTVISQIPLPSKTNKALPREPWAVRISVKRKDFDEPITSIVRFDAVAATQKRDNTLVLTDMWQKRGDAQTAKCSEADALRKAFPEELGSLYLSEEIKNEEEPNQALAVPASVVPLPPVVPKVDQAPAQPVETPRPNETLDIPLGQGTKCVGIEPTIPVAPAVAAALASVPGLKVAAEIPAPPKKVGRPKGKKSDPENPVNGQPVEQGITQADIDNASKPSPVVDEEANQLAAREFVEEISNMTSAEASELGLPEPPEYSKLPSPDEAKSFIARARALVEPGVDIKSVGDYTLKLAEKTGMSSKTLTVGDWTNALANMESAKAGGTLKEFLKEVKNVPLPAEF